MPAPWSRGRWRRQRKNCQHGGWWRIWQHKLLALIYQPEARERDALLEGWREERDGRARSGIAVVGWSAGCVHLNLHLPTAKTNKRLIGQGEDEGTEGINCCRADSNKLCDVTAAKQTLDQWEREREKVRGGGRERTDKTDAGHKQIKLSLVEKLIFCA